MAKYWPLFSDRIRFPGLQVHVLVSCSMIGQDISSISCQNDRIITSENEDATRFWNCFRTKCMVYEIIRVYFLLHSKKHCITSGTSSLTISNFNIITMSCAIIMRSEKIIMISFDFWGVSKRCCKTPIRGTFALITVIRSVPALRAINVKEKSSKLTYARDVSCRLHFHFQIAQWCTQRGLSKAVEED